EAGNALSDVWNAARTTGGRYDLSVFGPNGFLRGFRGSLFPDARANLDVEARYDADKLEVELNIRNVSPGPCVVSFGNAYAVKGDDDGDDNRGAQRLRPGQAFDVTFRLKKSFGWYDIAITVDTDPQYLRRLAGHLENGQDSASDPAFGR